jgi:hypothetical protein
MLCLHIAAYFQFCHSARKMKLLYNREHHCIAMVDAVRAQLLFEVAFWRPFCGKWLERISGGTLFLYCMLLIAVLESLIFLCNLLINLKQPMKFMILYMYIIPLDVALCHGVVVGCCFLRCAGTLVLLCKIKKRRDTFCSGLNT